MSTSVEIEQRVADCSADDRHRILRVMAARSHRVVAAALLVLAGSSCDSGPSGPVAGDLEFTVVSPNGPEGAALIDLQTAASGPITATGARVFANRLSNRTRILLVRTNPGTLTFRISVSDVRTPPAAALLEVAGPTNQIRSITGYRIESAAFGAP